MARPSRRTRYTATELLDTEFPAPRWAVPGILSEGLNLLAGSPKLGKSWLGLGLCVAVGSGGYALGKIPVDQGEALYLALEDTPRRLQSRLRMVLERDPAPDGVTFEVEWPRMADGGAELLDEWLTDHPDTRLVVVDVLARVRQHTSSRESVYAGDYQALEPLKDLADRHGVCVLVLHHVRKAGADDFVDTVSGSHGLAGSADAVLVMKRSRGHADADLYVTGRDIEEAEYALSFDATRGTWTLLGDADEWSMSSERRAIVDAVRAAGALKPKELAEASGVDYGVVKHLVRRMVDADQLDTDGAGTYLPPAVHPVHPIHPDELQSEHGEQSERGDEGAAA